MFFVCYVRNENLYRFINYLEQRILLWVEYTRPRERGAHGAQAPQGTPAGRGGLHAPLPGQGHLSSHTYTLIL